MRSSIIIATIIILIGCSQEEDPALLAFQQVQHAITELNRPYIAPNQKLREAARGRSALEFLSANHADSNYYSEIQSSALGLSEHQILEHFDAYNSLCHAFKDELTWHYSLQDERLQTRYQWWLYRAMVLIHDEAWVIDNLEYLDEATKARVAHTAIDAQNDALAAFIISQTTTDDPELLRFKRHYYSDYSRSTINASYQLENPRVISVANNGNQHTRPVFGDLILEGETDRALALWNDVIESNELKRSDKRRAAADLMANLALVQDYPTLFETIDAGTVPIGIDTLEDAALIAATNGDIDEAEQLLSLLDDQQSDLLSARVKARRVLHEPVDELFDDQIDWAQYTTEARFYLLAELVVALSEKGQCNFETSTLNSTINHSASR